MGVEQKGVETRQVEVGGHSITFTRVEGFNGDGLPLAAQQKIVPLEELQQLGEFYHKRRKTIAFTTGALDLKHNGHDRYLYLASTLGDMLVVGLNSDKSVKTLKGEERPILSEEVRAEALCALGFVTYVTMYDERTGANTIRLLKPDSYLCVDGSWEGKLEEKEEVLAMAGHGGRIFYTPRQSPTLSTTAILQRIEDLQKVHILKQLQEQMAVKPVVHE